MITEKTTIGEKIKSVFSIAWLEKLLTYAVYITVAIETLKFLINQIKTIKTIKDAG